MEKELPLWNKEEFKAYVLLYAANANYFETEEERELLLKKIDPDVYTRLHRELDHDNDYQRIQKILYNIKQADYSDEELENIVEEMRELITTDGYHDSIEETMFLALRKLLHPISS